VLGRVRADYQPRNPAGRLLAAQRPGSTLSRLIWDRGRPLPVCTGSGVVVLSCLPEPRYAASGRQWTIDRFVEEDVVILSPDTAHEIKRLLIELLRRMPAWC
jgi:hypothetical protein